MAFRTVAADDLTSFRSRSMASKARCRRKTLVLPIWMPTSMRSTFEEEERGVEGLAPRPLLPLLPPVPPPTLAPEGGVTLLVNTAREGEGGGSSPGGEGVATGGGREGAGDCCPPVFLSRDAQGGGPELVAYFLDGVEDLAAGSAGTNAKEEGDRPPHRLPSRPFSAFLSTLPLALPPSRSSPLTPPTWLLPPPPFFAAQILRAMIPTSTLHSFSKSLGEGSAGGRSALLPLPTLLERNEPPPLLTAGGGVP
mmetsp:Transcript_8647/g.15876  ORF Transcript_8647/g.15876 Transcript_8647/m.15876 type:complete len:252 (-) Transcript_8647:349-1104(-)